VPNHLGSLGEPASRDQRHVRLYARIDRTSGAASRAAILANHVRVGRSLCIEAVDGLANAYASVEHALDLDRADLGALAAGRALRHVDEARPLTHRSREVASLAVQLDHVRHGQDVDVLVPHAFDELGRDDAGRAVTGGEGLVKTGHPAADGGVLVDEIDAVAAG